MQWNEMKKHYLLPLAIAGAFAAAPASADKPSWAGKDKSHKSQASHDSRETGKHGGDDRDRHSRSGNHGAHFGDHDRDIVRDYYAKEFHKGKRCPPGLAKKHNGCMPPGQAKKWKRGHPLPREVVFHDLPRQLVLQLPAPPDGRRYVRVASDILLIAIGTGMVIDAIQDLGDL